MTDPAEQQDQDMMPEKYEGPTGLVVQDDGEYKNILDTARFNHLWRVAKTFAASQMVPEIFRNDPNSCMVALQMAFRLKVDPMMFLQKSYVIKGRPGIEATLAVALANTHGPFTGPIQYKWSGEKDKDDWTCTAYATHSETNELCEMPLDLKTVKAEGWYEKGGSKWKTMPRLMFMYRSAMWLIRAFCPEVILGLHSIDELQDTGGETIDITPIEATHAKLKVLKQEVESGLTEKEREAMPGQVPPSEKPVTEEEAFRAEWINLRHAGYSDYIFKNLDAIKIALKRYPGLEAEMKAKWEKVGYTAPWPLDPPEESGPPEEPEGWLPNDELADIFKRIGMDLEAGGDKIRDYMAAQGLEGDEIEQKLADLGIYTDPEAWESFWEKVLTGQPL
jgi:hypothetical protein